MKPTPIITALGIGIIAGTVVSGVAWGIHKVARWTMTPEQRELADQLAEIYNEIEL